MSKYNKTLYILYFAICILFLYIKDVMKSDNLIFKIVWAIMTIAVAVAVAIVVYTMCDEYDFMSYSAMKINSLTDVKPSILTYERLQNVVDISDTDISFNASYILYGLDREFVFDVLNEIVHKMYMYSISNTGIALFYVDSDEDMLSLLEKIFTENAIMNMRNCENLGLIDITKVLMKSMNVTSGEFSLVIAYNKLENHHSLYAIKTK